MISLANLSTPLLLDGPTGTELERRGAPLESPLWSAAVIERSPDLLAAVHHDYLSAGADLLTANTFRTNPATIRAAGRDAEDAPRLTRLAVRIAREVIGSNPLLLAGSVAPVGDCYRPADRRSDHFIREDHAAHILSLQEAGVDLLLLETMNSVAEAEIVADLARQSTLPFLISLVTDRSGIRLLDGTALREAVGRLRQTGPAGILLNCASPAATLRGVTILAEESRRESEGWIYGGYPNSGDPDPQLGWERVRRVSDEDFDRTIHALLERGSRLVGSCCGTTPATTARIRQILDRAAARPA